MRILLIDFYDSFVYNLAHYFQSIGFEVEVKSDQEIDLNQLHFLDVYSGVVLSPGPGLPEETRSMLRVIEYCDSKIPVFGVCLGMQGIGLFLGGSLKNLGQVRHGISSTLVMKKESSLFNGLMEPIEIGLYHSWCIERVGLELVTATDEQGVIMALECEQRLLYGLQFHPESVMTPEGKKIIENVGNIFLVYLPK